MCRSQPAPIVLAVCLQPCHWDGAPCYEQQLRQQQIVRTQFPSQSNISVCASGSSASHLYWGTGWKCRGPPGPGQTLFLPLVKSRSSPCLPGVIPCDLLAVTHHRLAAITVCGCGDVGLHRRPHSRTMAGAWSLPTNPANHESCRVNCAPGMKIIKAPVSICPSTF